MTDVFCVALTTAAAHHGRHARADRRGRLEDAGPEHVQHVREEDRPDQRGVLQVLQRRGARGQRAGGQDAKPGLSGTRRRPARAGPPAVTDRVRAQAARGEYPPSPTKFCESFCPFH